MKLLYSNIIGKGSPILVFHGLFGNGSNWISFSRNFSNEYQIHLIDIRNHGYSFYSDNMNYNIMSEDVINYIKHYNLVNPILLGHSIGGRIVMNFSFKYPFIPIKIIIVDITNKAYTTKENNFISILKNIDFSLIKKRSDFNIYLKKFIHEKKIISFFSKCVGVNNNGKLYFRFYLYGIEKNYDILIKKRMELKKEYNGLTLFLKGENSNYISYNDYKYMNFFFPKSMFVTIKNAGHWIHIDNPIDFYKEIRFFLKKK
ncbi:alpha/beta fold hydrolase [Blattabacterium cuenoti]|uniref:alpha/beta fold hydrolase n=1 Tax=Blattabacterium cuenoti TaxID=1653831 RepID=UPI00163BE89E|nr:alpha/beta fold hydrolase [Blattabacterium cuenoti]